MKVTLSGSHRSGNEPDPLSDIDSNRRVRNAAFFAAGALLYWLLSSTVAYFAGENIVRLTPFFVGAAGYFFGVAAGTLASVVAIVIHTVVFNNVGHVGFFAAFEANPAVHIGILLIGPLMGQLRRAEHRLRVQSRLRQGAEIELRAIEFRYRQIVERHQEEADFVSADFLGEETVLEASRAHSPRAGGQRESAEVNVSPVVRTGLPPGPQSILIAVAESTVQHQIRRALMNKELRTVAVDDGRSALEESAQSDGPVDLLITDAALPDMEGRELVASMRSKTPTLKVLYISGYIGSARVKGAELGPATSFLSKPFSSEALERKVRLLLDAVVSERSTPAPYRDPGVDDTAVPPVGVDDDGIHVQFGD